MFFPLLQGGGGRGKESYGIPSLNPLDKMINAFV